MKLILYILLYIIQNFLFYRIKTIKIQSLTNMGYPKLEKIKNFVFNRMLPLNRIEFTSLSLALTTLVANCLFGTFLILMVFFADESTFSEVSEPIKNRLVMQMTDEITNNIMTTSFFSMINMIIIILLLNFFRKESSGIIDKIFYVILVLLQSIKYLLIIIICSQIRSLVLSQDIVFSIINVINLVLLVFWNILFENFYFTLNYSSKNLLARFNFPYHTLTQTLFIILAIVFSFIGIDNLDFGLKLILNLVVLSIKVFVIYNGLLKMTYVNKKVQFVFAYFLMLEMNILTGNLFLMLSNEPLIEQNFLLVMSITSFLSLICYVSYYEWTQQDIYFKRSRDIKEAFKAQIFMKALFDLVSKSQQTQNHSLIRSSLRKQHEMECSKASCYCRINKMDVFFIKQYALEQLEDIRANFKNNPQILIQELNFRFHMFQSYPEILTKLEMIRGYGQLGLSDQFSILTLTKQLIEFIDDKNAVAHTIDVQSPLRLEEVAKRLETIIKKDIEKKTKKWKYLSRGLCRIEQLQQDTNYEINFLKQITNLHHEEMPSFKRSTLFNNMLMFYYKKVAFLSYRTQQIQKNLSDQLKKIKQQQLYAPKQFSKWIFHKRSCIVESLIDDQNMGLVTRSSKNIYQMFGYHQSKVVGMNLNKLMPNFMAVEHDLIIKDWIKTGTWRTVGKLKQIFCIHKDQFCFTALIYLKVIANEKGLFFIGVVFKENDSDYLVLNQGQQIEGMGRKFLHLIGQNCRKLPIQILCQDFPSLDLTRSSDYKSFTKTFRSLRNDVYLPEQFLQEKNRKYLQDEEQKKFTSEYIKKMEQSKTFEKWEVKFGLKVFKMRELMFYVVVLNFAKIIQTENGGDMRNDVIVGTGKVNEDEEFDISSQNGMSELTLGQRQAQFFEQKNSSMVSFAQRQSFTLSKLLKIFYQLLITPSEIKNKRINTLNISTLLETLILTSIITSSFFIYIANLTQIKEYISANAQINEEMQLAILMYNKVISISQYQKQADMQQRFLEMTYNDLDEFYVSLGKQVENINLAVTQFHSEKLNDYLQKTVTWFYKRKVSREVSVLQFFQYYYYITRQIAHEVDENPKLIVLDDKQYELDRIKQNFPQLKNLTSSIGQQFTLWVTDTQRDLVIIAWSVMALFFIVTLIFFLYSYNYFSFRYNQKHNCLQLYKAIPPALIDKTKQYYQTFYQQLFSSSGGSLKPSSLENDLESLNQNQLIIEECPHSTMNSNKIKFLGKQKFAGWVKSFLLFMAINSLNILITYQIVKFVEPLRGFMNSINQIIDAQNNLLESYLDIKSAYLLAHTPRINATVIDGILLFMNQSEVTFNQMVMFESQTLTLYDPQFYQDFYNILVDNICKQTKQKLTQAQFNECMVLSKGGLIQDGVITYMNYFQRKLRSVLEDLKVNSTLRFKNQGRNYFMNRGFKQVDLAMSYIIKLFRKLIDRILIGYKKGIDYISYINIIVLILLISPQVISLVLWVHLVKEQKFKLSMLYGSVLMIPPNIIKHVKSLPRMAKKILEFSDT